MYQMLSSKGENLVITSNESPAVTIVNKRNGIFYCRRFDEITEKPEYYNTFSDGRTHTVNNVSFLSRILWPDCWRPLEL